MIQNTRFNKVFSDSQIEKIKKIVESNHDKMKVNDDPNRGRDDMLIGSDIDEELKGVVANIMKPLGDYYVWHVTYSEYNNNHLNPNLPKHIDPNYEDGSITFDYQLDANTNWPICIGGSDYHDVYECFDLNNNEAVIFDPTSQWHYRPEKIFNDGEYVRIVFFYMKPVGK